MTNVWKPVLVSSMTIRSGFVRLKYPPNFSSCIFSRKSAPRVIASKYFLS